MLRDLSASPLVEKTRYRVRHGAHVWDLDVFGGDNAGLVMAEIELAGEDEPFELPDWAGEEVTGDPRYYNASLAVRPFARW
jgi:adenylate cyclase